MKKLKKIIIVLISLIIIFIVTLLLVLRKDKNGNYIFENQNIQESEDDNINDESNIQISDYFIVKSCIQGYIDYLDKTNDIYYTTEENGERKYDPNLQKKVLYTLLSDTYIKNKNITEDNIDKNIGVYKESLRYYPIEIKTLKSDAVSTFKASGVIQNFDYNNSSMVYNIVNVDYSNNTYSIQNLTEKEYNDYKMTNENEKSIDNKEYNIFNTTQIDVQKVSLEYLNLYKFLTLANPQITYNMMTEEYRNKRFGSLDNYKQYVKDNIDEFKGIVAKEYLTSNSNDVIQYVIKDQYENLYIFDVKSTMDYTIKLDTYTLDEEKFKTTYNNADGYEKVQMNIDKFIDMINRQDYRTSYSCLDDTFKKNTFKNEKEFENYIKNKLFKYNTFEVKELKSVGSNTYACNLSISDKTSENGGIVGITIIMQLLEGTNFVMSYSMN